METERKISPLLEVDELVENGKIPLLSETDDIRTVAFAEGKVTTPEVVVPESKEEQEVSIPKEQEVPIPKEQEVSLPKEQEVPIPKEQEVPIPKEHENTVIDLTNTYPIRVIRSLKQAKIDANGKRLRSAEFIMDSGCTNHIDKDESLL